MIEEHRERGATLSEAAQVGGVAEHLGQRHVGGDDLGVAARGHALDLAAARVQAADDVAHVLVRRRGLDAHDRLEDLGAALRHRLADRHGGGDLEGHLRRVDLVVRAVVERDLHVDDREAQERTALHGFLDALLDGRDEVLRHGAADDDVLEDIARTARVRLGLDLDVAVLTATAGLAHELALDVDRTRDGLAVGDLRGADVGVDVELALEAVDDDLEVQLAHP